MHRHKKYDPTNPEGRWVFPYVLLIAVSGVMVVGFGQHDRYVPAIICLAVCALGAKLLLRAFSLMDQDAAFHQRYEQRRAHRPVSLEDYQDHYGPGGRQVSHDTGEIRRP